jgi:hypothetical protein
MLIIRIDGRLNLLALMLLSAACGSQPSVNVTNPVADGLRVQARQLNRQSQTCRIDASAYGANHPELRPCGSSLMQIDLNSGQQQVDQCVARILGEVPACRSWDEDYRAMVGANEYGNAGTSPGVELMEIKELAPKSPAIDESGTSEPPTGD